jgi:hypothetical protein
MKAWLSGVSPFPVSYSFILHPSAFILAFARGWRVRFVSNAARALLASRTRGPS